MLLRSLNLTHFRSFSSKKIEFNPHITIIVGPNAVGKTSIIEAIYLLATGNSFRAGRVEEMISLNQEIGRIKGVVVDDIDTLDLEVMLTRGIVQGKRTAHRLYSKNGLKKRKQDVVGLISAVVFRPEDMRLVEGSPSRRREFIDLALGGIDREYAQSLTIYEQTLKRRNRLLEQVREHESPRTVLTFWNLQLVKHGQIIQSKRQTFFTTFQDVSFPMSFQLEYQPSVMSESRLAEYLDREIMVGHSLIGPHKDDFSVQLHLQEWQPLSAYGSRGQQRLGVFWLKVCELAFITHHTSQRPLLLLDDILSELDETSQSYVLTLLTQGQTLITTTDQTLAEHIQHQFPQAHTIAV